MKCPRCQHENEAGAKFCEECAMPLARACAKCGRQLSPAAKFCPECAHPTGLSAAPLPAPRFGSPESYTPRHLAEKILTSKAALEGERKQVTVLFADLKGSMELLADRDPEEARKLLDPVLERMMEAVHHYEGTVNQVMGDGIMALFGAPLAHEDHAVRACYAALRMQESVARYAEDIRRRHGLDVQIRVGLNSGEVVVRAIGSDLHMDYTAVGQTTHLAARVEQLARPGTIVIAPDTLALAEGYVEVKSLGPVPVKGLADPVEVYEVTGAGPARTRLQAAARRGLTRFVGRDAEVEQLRRAQQLASTGHGQVAALVGEAGVGKSRLLYEFTHSHRVQGWLVLESTSVSYGKATSYLPVVDLLKNYFKIQDRDDRREIREKVTGKLLTLDRALEPVLPALLALLDVPVDDVWQALDPGQRRQRTLDAVKRLLLREAREQPLLLIFEDLHWIDGETQALLDGLVESLGSARLLLVVNYRPEYQHTWSGKTYYSQMRLDALPAESAGELLKALLGEDPGLAPLKQLLVKRGNPFFLEEAVRTLVETKALAGERGRYRLTQPVQAIKVPATVQAMLAARMDRLPAGDKRLLQTASVVGKDVPFALLQAIAELPEEALRRGLDHLQAAEFLDETGLFQDLECTFKHALTHEVAYGSLLQERRRLLHAQIAEAIERLYAGRLTEHVERLAHHSLKGEVWAPAVRYLWQAGTKAAERYALREAAAWLDQALSALAHLPESRTTLEHAVDIGLERMPAITTLGDYRVAHAHVRDLERLAEQLGDERRRGHVYRIQVNIHNHRGELEDAVAWGDRALEIADRLGDLKLRARTITNLEQTHFMGGEYQRAADLAKANLSAVPEALDERVGAVTPTSVYDRGWLVRSLVELGEFAEATEPAEAAIRIAERTQQPYAIGWACYCAGTIHTWKGDWGAARSLYERAIEVFREGGVVTSLSNVMATGAWVLACLGESSTALTRALEAERLLELARVQQRMAGNAWSYFWLCQSYLRLGRPQDAERVVPRVLEPRTTAAAAHASYLEAEIAVHPDRWQPETAAERYRSALQLAARCGMRPLMAHGHLGLGKLYRRTDKRGQAQEHFATATTMYRDMGMTYWLERAEAEMRSLA